MTEFMKIKRPPEDAGAPEIREYLRELGRDLEAIGVAYGEEFAVVPGESIGTQASLDDLGGLGPFAKDSETSRAAALDTYPRSGSHRWKILRALVGNIGRGLTREELEQLGLSGNTIRPRVQELIDGGFIEETETTRSTRSGSQAVLLRPTEKGLEEARKHGD